MRYFPEIARLARTALPEGVLLDGELVVWDPDRERLSFAALQRRIAGPVLHLAARQPATFMAFDLLADAPAR